METRANHALIGAFTLAVIASAFMFVFWFSGGEKVEGRKVYRIVFTGSVSGLSRGAQVLFNGLRVGEVTKLGLMDEDPSRVAATIDVDARTPVKTDTHAQLEFTGLTGIASIALTGGGNSTPPLEPGVAGETPVIYGDKSDIQNLLANVQSLSAKADSILTKADNLLGEGDGSIKTTLKNVEIFSKALADNAKGVGDFLASASDIARSLKPLAANLNTLVGQNAEAMTDTVHNAQLFSKSLAESGPGISSFVASMADIGKAAAPLPAKLVTLSDSANLLLGAVDAAQVKKIVGDTESLTRKLNGTADSANAVIAAIDPKQVQSVVSDAADITRKLNATSSKIDTLIASAQSLVGSPDANGTMRDIGDAARAIKKLADNLDIRSRDIATGITRFTGQGLRQYELLATDSRRSLDQLNRAVRGLEKNPQQLIFGGKPAIPEYSGK